MATQQLSAEVTYSDGSTEDATSTTTWESSDTDVCTVSDSGRVTSVGEGTATVTATIYGLSDTSEITVTAPEPDPESLDVTPSSSDMTHED